MATDAQGPARAPRNWVGGGYQAHPAPGIAGCLSGLDHAPLGIRRIRFWGGGQTFSGQLLVALGPANGPCSLGGMRCLGPDPTGVHVHGRRGDPLFLRAARAGGSVPWPCLGPCRETGRSPGLAGHLPHVRLGRADEFQLCRGPDPDRPGLRLRGPLAEPRHAGAVGSCACHPRRLLGLVPGLPRGHHVPMVGLVRGSTMPVAS